MDYLGISYSLVVASGGLMGYMKAKSIPSLVAGLGFGAILAGGAYMTSQTPPQPLLQLGTAAVLGGIMGKRFYNSRKIMPAGIVAGISAVVLIRGLVLWNQNLLGTKE